MNERERMHDDDQLGPILIALFQGVLYREAGAAPWQALLDLQARIVQVRDVEDGTVVGYGARYVADGPRRIATIGIGYADGWLRSLSCRGHAYIDEVRVPFAGNVSMDSITLDVTGIAEDRVQPGCEVELLGSRRYDVLFSDVSLPGMSGVDLARESLRRHPHLKVIFASGYGDMLLRHLEFPYQSLQKPYELDQLQDALNKVSGQPRVGA